MEHRCVKTLKVESIAIIWREVSLAFLAMLITRKYGITTIVVNVAQEVRII